jgi:hypothetical protein
MKIQGFHRHFGRLMGREASPFVPVAVANLFGELQISYSLGPPVSGSPRQGRIHGYLF